MNSYPHDQRSRRLRTMMAVGAAVCVLTLAGVVTLHDSARLAGEGAASLVASDVPVTAASADFLHAPVTAGNVPAAETVFHGAPAPEEQPPTF